MFYHEPVWIMRAIGLARSADAAMTQCMVQPTGGRVGEFQLIRPTTTTLCLIGLM